MITENTFCWMVVGYCKPRSSSAFNRGVVRFKSLNVIGLLLSAKDSRMSGRIKNPQPGRGCKDKSCGEGGIRTLGTVSRTTVFETATIDRSATSPTGSAQTRGRFRLLLGAKAPAEQREAKVMFLAEKE